MAPTAGMGQDALQLSVRRMSMSVLSCRLHSLGRTGSISPRSNDQPHFSHVMTSHVIA
jgi:hypothetical protein